MYSYKTVPIEWRDPDQWPTIDASIFTQEEKSRFDRISLGFRDYLSTGALGRSALEAGCSKSHFLSILNRCLSIFDGNILGWSGLISHLRVSGYKRRKPPAQGRKGQAGVFSQFLLENPQIKEKLDDLIKSGGGGRIKAGMATRKSVYRGFKAVCVNAGFTDKQYPLNTRSKGRRSIERYIDAQIKHDSSITSVWCGKEASVGRRLGTGKRSFEFSMAPLDVVGIDAHKIHCIGVVKINGPAGKQIIPISRLWLVAYLDKRSRCGLGYSVAIRDELSSSNIEDAILCGNNEWKPRQLIIKGLEYLPGACLPCGNIPGLNFCRPNVLLLDNAAQHFSNRIAEKLRRNLGCFVTWGSVGAWWRNSVTERLFKTLETYGFQRLPSTTGSNAVDFHGDNSVRAAIDAEIEWDELIDLVDLIFTGYNVTSSQGLGNQSPLQVLERGIKDQSFIPRKPLPATANTPRLGIVVEVRTVRGSIKPGSVKNPYLEIDKARYSSPALAARFELIGESITVHIDERDMRVVAAYTMKGQPIGDLNVLTAGWRDTRHDRDMRKSVNQLITDGEIGRHVSDYIYEYLIYLAKKAHEEAIEAPSRVSASASKLVDAARTSGRDVPVIRNMKKNKSALDILNRPLPGNILQPKWRQK